jgi:hypothetical protein
MVFDPAGKRPATENPMGNRDAGTVLAAQKDTDPPQRSEFVLIGDYSNDGARISNSPAPLTIVEPETVEIKLVRLID